MAQNEKLKNKVMVNSNGDENIEEIPLYKKKRLIIPLLLIFIAAVITGYFWFVNMQNFVSTDDAYIDANSVSISSKILGRIVYLGTDGADTVKASQILVKLDDTDLKAQEASAKAELQLAQKSILLAEVNVKRAQQDFDRGEGQYKNGVITQEQYDHLKAALDAAKAEYEIELSRISAAKSKLDVVETQLSNTVITSPMDGVVAKRWVLVGDVVQPGQPIFTIYDLKNIWVTANLEETKLAHVKLGGTVEIDVDSYPDMKFYGKVFEIGNYTASQFSLIPPNNASGNFTKVTQRVPIKISIQPDSFSLKNDPPKFKLLPGMSVEIKIRKQ
ncbi:HlyD family secretion protein [Melioribacteraceae bacterium 4301-Me]|uniref:HlyD family secretion protein n=1 Tax=Pyranulibacter aquaticus TaxID=3163344 RepID=UPI00359B6E6B